MEIVAADTDMIRRQSRIQGASLPVLVVTCERLGSPMQQHEQLYRRSNTRIIPKDPPRPAALLLRSLYDHLCLDVIQINVEIIAVRTVCRLRFLSRRGIRTRRQFHVHGSGSLAWRVGLGDRLHRELRRIGAVNVTSRMSSKKEVSRSFAVSR